jgi:ABC-type multidrug transport system fused ATPase/permease subunit
MPRSVRSFFVLTRDTLQLLSGDQRRKIIKNIVLSIGPALLDALSIAIIIPVLNQALDQGSEKSTLISKGLFIPPGSIPWQALLIMLVAVFLLKNLSSLWLSKTQSTFLNNLYITFSEQIYYRFYHQPWTDYVKENSAETFRKIKNTAFDFTNNVLSGYLSLLTDLFVCLTMTVVLIWLDYRIVFILSILCLPVIASYYFFRKNVILKIDRSFRYLTPQANVLLSQGINSFAEAKIYRKENYFINHFITIIRITSKQLADLKTFVTMPSRLLEIVGIICLVFLIAYAKLYPAYQQSLLIFLGLLLIALYRIVPSLNKILISLSQIQTYAYSVSELKESLRSEDKPQEASVPHAAVSFKREIVFRDIAFQYFTGSSDLLLKDLNFKICKADFLVLEGPSGVGKTTLIHLIAGLIQDYQGQILIDGVPLSAATLQGWQNNLGLVPQAPVVLQNTILNNIAFGDEEDKIVMERVKYAAELSGIHELIQSLPLQYRTLVGENGLTLSGGQRQRLMLARALYRDPHVLLLDEVTNQLDEENKIYVLNMLQSLTKKGKTVVLASHDHIVKRYATCVFRLEKGHIHEIKEIDLHSS